ncbi:MAG: cytochrome c3 family protein, partial [Thermoanaerobaculia bacterium]
VTMPADLPERPQPAGIVTLPARLGPVSFDHGQHASGRKIDCATCHHPSRPEKPLAARQQACRECHAQPAVAPMKTSLREAFHDAKATRGICVDCHRDPKNGDLALPSKCADCHRKSAG